MVSMRVILPLASILLLVLTADQVSAVQTCNALKRVSTEGPVSYLECMPSNPVPFSPSSSGPKAERLPILLQTTYTPWTEGGCRNQLIRIDTSTPDGRNLFSIALTAMTTGLPVTVSGSPCVNGISAVIKIDITRESISGGEK